MYNFTMPALLAAALVTAISVQPAEARIKCRDGFQSVQGSWLSTPYCRDAQVAAVARSYGVRVSDVAIRENPNLKRHVCRFIGQDIRVKDSCMEVSPYNRRF